MKEKQIYRSTCVEVESVEDILGFITLTFGIHNFDLTNPLHETLRIDIFQRVALPLVSQYQEEPFNKKYIAYHEQFGIFFLSEDDVIGKKLNQKVLSGQK